MSSPVTSERISSPPDKRNPAAGDLTVIEIGPEGFALECFSEAGEWERLGVYPTFDHADEIRRIAGVAQPGANNHSAAGPQSAVPLSTVDRDPDNSILDDGVVGSRGGGGRRWQVTTVPSRRPASALAALMEAPPGAEPESSPEDDEALRAVLDEALADLLTPRQREVLEFTAAGWTSRQIGAELGIAYKSAEDALAKARAKLRGALAHLGGRRPRVSPATHPERYEPFAYGPPEAVCTFCSPKRRQGVWGHSGECVGKASPVEWMRLPVGPWGAI